MVFTQHHLLNTLVDSSGKPQISIENDVMFIKRKGLFSKENITSVFKTKPVDPVKSTATIKIPTITSNEGGQKGVYRLQLYIRQSGQTDSRMATNLPFQGKPFSIEFEIFAGEDAVKGAKRLAETIQKVQYRTGDDMVQAKNTEDQVLISMSDEYRLITEARLQKLNEDDEFENIAVATRKGDIQNDGVNTIYPNQNGVGTYDTILRSVRYPTSTARRFGGINQEELPIPTSRYVQYNIHICNDRGVMGTDSLGDTVKAASVHVFYVREELADKFEENLETLGVDIKDINIEVDKPEIETETETETGNTRSGRTTDVANKDKETADKTTADKATTGKATDK